MQHMTELYIMITGGISLTAIAGILATAAYFSVKRIVLDLLPVIRGSGGVR